MDYYVYSHTANGEIFYVGKGRGKRAYSRHCRNPHWHNIVKKYGFAVNFIAEGLSENQAFVLEQTTIQKLKSNNLCKTNYVDGGRGVPGLRFTAESKQKMSNSLKIRNANPTPAMLDWWRKISVSKKIQWKNPSEAMVLGTKKSGATRRGRTKYTHSGVARMAAKLADSMKGAGNPNHKWQWITPKGIFFSAVEAATAHGIAVGTVKRRCGRTDKWIGWTKESYNG